MSPTDATDEALDPVTAELRAGSGDDRPRDGDPRDDRPLLDDPFPRRRWGRRAVAVGAVLAAAGAGAWILTRDGARPATPEVNRSVPTGVATVERRDLVDRQDVDGTLEFAGDRRVAAPAAGILTRLRAEGSIVSRGRPLLWLDGHASAFVMYGAVPMYRELRSGVSDGADVRQLQRNLAALGYDPYGALVADGEWSAATTAAVKRWEDARGVDADGRVPLGEILFTGGPVRVGSHAATVGDRLAPGAPVTDASSTRRVINGQLEASRQASVDEGDKVEVTLPDGDVARGVVERVGRVAKAGQDGGEATVSLRVGLRGRLARSTGLDRAPVTISVATEAARNALSVPVTALVARGSGRYAVELRGGRLVPIETGVFADGYVEVSGRLREGDRVVVPR
ncbi:Putative peptidoglycan binding domain 1 [Patulibacter medicamentivorans]|uniref:Putative peptidoglycan binding domain 1 n=1 Tax=Patulibacter medicamentivorans TaxID=1097667 RepID=H0E9Y2_9ACTN|nr:peptidoglycan-binding protein [Patulibacter medicamentivorans]EHN09510.1 Putative peptidoglycan binding domain 1 [Patulibacter medicamentivorans]